MATQSQSRPRPEWRGPAWRAAYLLVVTAAGYAAFRHWAYDDPFITYRYATNLASGTGFVYNPGLRVLSTTTPLYALLLAALSHVWADIPSLSNLIGAASVAVGGLALAGLWRLWQGRGEALVLVLYPLTPILYQSFGSEMPLFVTLCLACLLAYASRRYLPAAVLAGLAVLTRGDAAALLAILAGHFVVVRREPVPWRAVALFVAMMAAWVAFALPYFGSPLPATLGAKRSQGGMAISQSFLGGLADLVRAYMGSWGYRIEAGLLLVGLAFVVTRRPRWCLLLAWPLVYALAYALLGIPRYFWYYVPLVPATVVLVCLGATTVAEWLRTRVRRGSVAVALLLGLGALVVLAHGVRLERLRRNPDARVAAYTAVGRWLAANTPPVASVGTLEVGVIGYYSGRPMVDFAGLIQPDVGRQLTRDGTYEAAARWAIGEYRPAYLVLNPSWFPGLDAEVEEQGCTTVQRFAGADYAYAGDLAIMQCAGQ